MRRKLFFAVIYLTVSCAIAQNRYYNYHTGFKIFQNDSICRIQDKCLILDNVTNHNIFNLSEEYFYEDTDFQLDIRLANLHSETNKKYHYKDIQGNKKFTKNPGASIVFNYLDSSNYYILHIQPENSVPDDNYSTRAISLRLCKISNSQSEALFDQKIKDNVDLYDGFNNFQISKINHNYNFMIGSSQLLSIGSCEIPNGEGKWGFAVAPGACISIKHIVFRQLKATNPIVIKDWSEQGLDDYFKKSTDPVEGYWAYLDRKINNDNIKLGGKYRLALVYNGNGYDIIYIDGAQRNPSRWKVGAIKGYLTPTRFVDNFNLEWYDADNKIMNDDTYARIIDYSILELNFPVAKSSFRLSKEK